MIRSDIDWIPAVVAEGVAAVVSEIVGVVVVVVGISGFFWHIVGRTTRSHGRSAPFQLPLSHVVLTKPKHILRLFG